MSSSSDWSNVRVKEEPMSDFEDGRRSSYNERDRDRGNREGRRKDRRSPSPPPSHSRQRSKTSPQRSRSRSRSNSREREREKRRGSSRWEGKRSGSGERVEPRRDDRDRERRRPPSRERDSDRSRFDDRRIKQERRSPSPRFRSPPPRPGPRRDEERRDRGQGHSSRDRPRDGANGGGRFADMKCYKCNETGHISRNCPQGGSSSACFKCKQEGHMSRECPSGNRERDWNNFFNPKSEMSQQANMKREKEEQDRKVAIGQGGGGAFGKKEEDPEKPKEQPNFGLSGKLTEETNTFRGVVVKYSEPPEARKPNKIRWRLYPFKGEEALQVMYIHRQSAYLLGRDRKVADIPVDHPSCSKQHAVIQYRLVPYVRPDGSKGRRIKPYIIDLESANGTFVNEKQIDPKRYVELFEKDVLKFGFSSREYVLLHDESKDIQDDSPELTPD